MNNIEELKQIANEEWELAKQAIDLTRTKESMDFIRAAMSRINAIDSKLMEAGRYDLLG